MELTAAARIDESYSSIHRWRTFYAGEVCFGHHRGVDYGPGHNHLHTREQFEKGRNSFLRGAPIMFGGTHNARLPPRYDHVSYYDPGYDYTWRSVPT